MCAYHNTETNTYTLRNQLYQSNYKTQKKTRKGKQERNKKQQKQKATENPFPISLGFPHRFSPLIIACFARPDTWGIFLC